MLTGHFSRARARIPGAASALRRTLPVLLAAVPVVLVLADPAMAQEQPAWSTGGETKIQEFEMGLMAWLVAGALTVFVLALGFGYSKGGLKGAIAGGGTVIALAVLVGMGKIIMDWALKPAATSDAAPVRVYAGAPPAAGAWPGLAAIEAAAPGSASHFPA